MKGRLALTDRVRIGALGLVSRPGRTALSALGIAIGITALVGVLGLSESSRADLNRQLEALGTNMVTVQPGDDFGGGDATLPDASVGMIDRIASVSAASAVRDIDATVRKNHLVPAEQTSGLSVGAADVDLLDTLRGELAAGHWLDGGGAPTVVLGSTAARRLAIDDEALARGVRVRIDGRWFAVVGILERVALAPELDETALMSLRAATTVWGDDLPPSTIYVRVASGQVVSTAKLVARTAYPADPTQVSVSRPSEALAAQAAADKTLTTLTLGLGAVALLVGAVGIANTMVISVLERRREIGVRR
ncbi:MAG: ABC transporter permease, partial [Propionibacteriales bacterium]|nr:ABC transporter permease [Propionibacteriales bacterium]